MKVCLFVWLFVGLVKVVLLVSFYAMLACEVKVVWLWVGGVFVCL